MTKLSFILKGALLPVMMLCISTTANATPRGAVDSVPFRYAQKANKSSVFDFESQGAKAHKAQATPVASLKGETNYGYLNGPDGTDWFYTVQYESTTITPPGFYEGYTETIISGYSFTIYDSNLKELGCVTDTIRFKGDESGIAAIMLDPCVTQKFFNSNENYEIVVSIAYNNPNYTVNHRSYAYSVGAAKDGEYHTPVAEIDGYIVSTVNAAPDQWSENFYLTFLTSTSDPTKTDLIEYLESCKNVLSIYKKAGWGSSCSLLDVVEVPMTHLPGDQESAPFFMSLTKDGKAVFALSRYEKRFYESPVGENENVIPDNKLQIFLYEVDYDGLKQVQLTEIPSIQSTEEGDVFTYYSIGGFGYIEDVDFGNFIEGETSFVVTQEIYNASSDDEQKVSFFLYDSNGNLVRTIAKNMYGMKRLNDLPSYEPQYLIVVADGNQLIFRFMDIYSGNIVAELPQSFEGYSLTMYTDRCLGGESYMWGVLLNNTEVDNFTGNAYDHIAWINADGQFIDHIDRINLGKDVAIAQINMSGNVLSPYLFNTNDDREYMVLLKRYVGAGTETKEELMICSSTGEAYLTATHDNTKGNLKTISVYNSNTNPQLSLVYSDGLTLTQDIYNLPLVKFANGGDGSLIHPYKVSSIGDLQQIQSNTSAHYILVNDIDASGYTFKPITGDYSFNGSINGNGYTIRNMTIGEDPNYGALFGNLGEGAVIKNLNFENVTIMLSESTSYAGILAGQSIETTIENVHVYGLKTLGNPQYASFGGFVGRTALHTNATGCSIENADINLPENAIGGIFGEALTGSKVNACKFSGKINGGSMVGGIVASTGTGDEEITNCHVDADIIAKNTIGGIIGASKRSKITNCYVEGNFEAVGPGWGSACVGGIVGELATNFQALDSEDATMPASVVVSGCLVNLKSLKGYATSGTPSYENEYNTIHRIIGRSSANELPESGNTTYPAEAGIADNYAVSSLAPVQSNLEAIATSVEGASIEVEAINIDFLKQLGFAYGTSAVAPWSESHTNDPALYFERSIMFSPVDITVKNGDIYTLTLLINDRNINTEDIKLSASNESVAKLTGNTILIDGTQPKLLIEFSCESEGSSVVTAEYLGEVAKCTVNAIASGITDITTDSENLINIEGSEITADNCTLTIYNIAGAMIATAENTIDATALDKGVYIIVATSVNGTKQILKIAVK